MIKLKPGVRIAGVRPEAAVGIQIAASVFAAHGHDCILTSVTDGQHSHGSLHYAGAAFDMRRRHIEDDATIQSVHECLVEALGADFDVVLEDTHWHVEYQPKIGVNL